MTADNEWLDAMDRLGDMEAAATQARHQTASESNELTPTQTIIAVVTGTLAGMRDAKVPRSDPRWWVLEMLEPAVLALPDKGDRVDQDIAALHRSRRSIERLTEIATTATSEEHIDTMRADLNDARDALTEALNARHEELVARAKTAEAEVARLSGLVRDFNTAAGTLATERDEQTDRADHLDAVVTAVREAITDPNNQKFVRFQDRTIKVKTVLDALDGGKS